MMAMQPSQNAIGWWKEKFWGFMRCSLGRGMLPAHTRPTTPPHLEVEMIRMHRVVAGAEHAVEEAAGAGVRIAQEERFRVVAVPVALHA